MKEILSPYINVLLTVAISANDTYRSYTENSRCSSCIPVPFLINVPHLNHSRDMEPTYTLINIASVKYRESDRPIESIV
jgi:predicted aldo/keto reductase-like oxidoreductase